MEQVEAAPEADPAEVGDAAVSEELPAQGAEIRERVGNEQQRDRQNRESGEAHAHTHGHLRHEEEHGQEEHRKGLERNGGGERERARVATAGLQIEDGQQHEEEGHGVELAMERADEDAHRMKRIEPGRHQATSGLRSPRGEKGDDGQVGGEDGKLDEDGEMAKAGRLIARGARPAPPALADDDQDLERL